MSQYCAVKQKLENLLGYLEPLLPFANCHMVDYFTKDAYKTYISPKIRSEISTVGENEVLNSILNRRSIRNALEINKFIDIASKQTLNDMESICLSSKELYEKFVQLGCSEIPGMKLEIFMSPKKSHEVEILSAIAAVLKHVGRTTHIIDIGDGKGYLSSLLALHYKIPVLGVDSSIINTNGASRRAEKLQRVWKGVEKAPKRSYPSKNEDLSSANGLLYKQITRFVDGQINFEELVTNVFLTNSKRFGLTGLHTCGNLSSTSLKIFSSDETIKTVINVGCCYNLLTELFEEVNGNENTEHGFPLSDFLKSRNFVLGRCARMLASQSLDRVLHEKSTNKKSVFYRALYQVFLERNCSVSPTKHVGRLKQQHGNFYEYVLEASKRIGVEIELDREEIEKIYVLYCDRELELDVFYLLRCLLAPVVETLILTDRLLFLLERGYENSFLVRLFDPVISPRCYGIVSYK